MPAAIDSVMRIDHSNNHSRKIHSGGLRRAGIAVLFWLAMLAPWSAGLAQDYGSSALAEDTAAAATEAETGANDTDTDKEDLRRTLMELLEPAPAPADTDTDAAGQENAYSQTLFDHWEQTETNKLGYHLSQLAAMAPQYPAHIKAAFALATSEETGWSGGRILFTCLMILALALACEWVTTRKLLRRLYHYVDVREKNNALKLKLICTRVLVQLTGLAVLAAVAYTCALLFIKQNPYLEFLFIELLVAFIKLRLWLVLLRSVFSPRHTQLRTVPLDDLSARRLYFWLGVFFCLTEFGAALLNYLVRVGFNDIQQNGLLIVYTLALNLIILSQIWRLHHKVAGMFAGSGANNSGYLHNFARDFLIHSWPFLFTAWLLLLWLLWLYKAFTGQWDDAAIITQSWWATLALPIADRLFNRLLSKVTAINWLQSPVFERRATRFIGVVQSGFRMLAIGTIVFMLYQALGSKTAQLMQDSFGQNLFRQGVNLLTISTIAYLVWELFHALVERNLPEAVEQLDPIASLEGDGGGEGLSRAETLLPLLKTVITVVLVLFLVLSVLHSLGIAIGPLLAGAGVVGIAIGFGAQKLVQDILGGIFFLIDDAFRRNEYIEIGTLRGTVEKISLRSMQLRHHLGAVQTIPYSEVKTVKNLSRDWITMKLELRLSYDTDIEEVRKIIKKVGQDLLKDPVMGPNFILPLKSQGVMRVEESALIVRMKYTAKPGEQWVIRREAYRCVRDALAAGGIHFAHREVTVRLPEDMEHAHAGKAGPSADADEQATALDKKKLLLAESAAAIGSVLAAEAAKQAKLDDDEDGDGGDDR